MRSLHPLTSRNYRCSCSLFMSLIPSMPSDSLYYELHGQAICPALPWEFLVTLYSIEAPRSLFAWTKKADPSLAFIHYLRAIGPRCACTLHGFRGSLNLGSNCLPIKSRYYIFVHISVQLLHGRSQIRPRRRDLRRRVLSGLRAGRRQPAAPRPREDSPPDDLMSCLLA